MKRAKKGHFLASSGCRSGGLSSEGNDGPNGHENFLVSLLGHPSPESSEHGEMLVPFVVTLINEGFLQELNFFGTIGVI